MFNSDALGSEAQPQNVVRPWECCVCDCIGEWPPWNETVEEARLRYASTLLSYLRRGADALGNFLLVTHADGVASMMSIMPFSENRCITRVGNGGLFLAKSLFAGLSAPSSPERSPIMANHAWQIKKRYVKTEESSGTNRLLGQAFDLNTMSVADMQVLISTCVRAELLQQCGLDSDTRQLSEASSLNPVDDDITKSSELSEATVVFNRQITASTLSMASVDDDINKEFTCSHTGGRNAASSFAIARAQVFQSALPAKASCNSSSSLMPRLLESHVGCLLGLTLSFKH